MRSEWKSCGVLGIGVLTLLLTGCVTSTDWSEKVGVAAFADVIKEYGDPNRNVKLDNGDTHCVWYQEARSFTQLDSGKWMQPLYDYERLTAYARVMTFDSALKLKKADFVSLNLYYPRNFAEDDFIVVFKNLARVMLDDAFTQEKYDDMAVAKLQGVVLLKRLEGQFYVFQGRLGPFNARVDRYPDKKGYHYYSYPVKGREVLLSFGHMIYRSNEYVCNIYCCPVN